MYASSFFTKFYISFENAQEKSKIVGKTILLLKYLTEFDHYNQYFTLNNTIMRKTEHYIINV